MPLYTRQGDDGRTSLPDGRRVFKDDPRITACGEVDELNSVLGWCRCAGGGASWAGRIEVIQRELFSVGAELAMPEVYRLAGVALAGADEVRRLESWIDEACAATPPLSSFILPGGTEPSARLHMARTVCRRAERTVVRLREDGAVRCEIIVYLNRLGDLLFAWARLADRDAGVSDVPWTPCK
jgi:cob(I)alamin adenosyltransferase